VKKLRKEQWVKSPKKGGESSDFKRRGEGKNPFFEWKNELKKMERGNLPYVEGRAKRRVPEQPQNARRGFFREKGSEREGEKSVRRKIWKGRMTNISRETSNEMRLTKELNGRKGWKKTFVETKFEKS